MRCVRCPTAYHIGDFCIGAGSLDLPGYNIVCPKHFKRSKSNKAVHSHVNVSWCFSCNNGKRFSMIISIDQKNIICVSYYNLKIKYSDLSVNRKGDKKLRGTLFLTKKGWLW